MPPPLRRLRPPRLFATPVLPASAIPCPRLTSAPTLHGFGAAPPHPCEIAAVHPPLCPVSTIAASAPSFPALRPRCLGFATPPTVIPARSTEVRRAHGPMAHCFGASPMRWERGRCGCFSAPPLHGSPRPRCLPPLPSAHPRPATRLYVAPNRACRVVGVSDPRGPSTDQ